MTVQDAMEQAEKVLPGVEAPVGELDPRWQAIIAVSHFAETDPEPVWEFAAKWGRHKNEDLRMAIACCLLEVLLNLHFSLIFPRIATHARIYKAYGQTFTYCWPTGEAECPVNYRKFMLLQKKIKRRYHV